MMARMAEASRTTSFMLGCLAPFRAQFVGNECPRFHVSAGPLLGAPDAASYRRYAQFALFDAPIQGIAYSNSDRFAHRRRNDNTALFTHARASPQFLKFHGSHLSHPFLW